MVIYTVEYWEGTQDVLDKIFLNIDKAKEFVEKEAEYLSDEYEVTKWVLDGDGFKPTETIKYYEKKWQEPKQVTQ